MYIHYINISLKLSSFQCLFQKVGGTYLYKSYSYAPPQRVGILRRFGLKMGIGLPILVWSRVWLSRELRECMKEFIVSIPNEYPGKREREICEVEMDFKESFCLLF